LKGSGRFKGFGSLADVATGRARSSAEEGS
jgi:hypothetical protein